MDNKMHKRRALFFILFLIVGNYIWNILFKDLHLLLDWGNVSFQVIASGVSMYWILSTYRITYGRMRFFWLFLAMGCFSYLIGILIWSYYEFVLKLDVSANQLSKLFWIGQNGFYFCALLIVLYKLKSKIRTLRIFLDTFIVMAVAVTFNWEFIISPIMDKAYTSVFQVDLLYPILDLGVFFGVISLITTSTTFFTNKTTILLLSGFMIQIIADTIFSYLTLHDIYKVGSVNEPLWILAFLLLGLSGVYQQAGESQKSYENSKLKTKNLLGYSLPYMSVILLLGFVVYRLHHLNSILLGLVVTILLVLVRQILTLVENEALVNELHCSNEKLETTVSKRTEELEDTLNKMEYLAYHDTLTGLPNRRFFESKLSEAIARFNDDGKKIILMLLDLDRFKYINDNLGHSYGDLLLKEVGSRLNECLDSLSLVGRIGGDEYTILMEQYSTSKAEQVAKKIIDHLGKPYFIKETELHITPSIGISIYPDHGTESETLFMQADMAMYAVKEKGKNNYQFFDFSMYDKSRLYLENSLRNAIKNQEFVLHYQPQISFDTGKIIGVEALIRWNKPGVGLIPPSEFIPLAEDTGLITPIGQWVIETACKQLVQWEKKGLPAIKMAVNLSSLQFQQKDFVQWISHVIQETGINPQLLELEITETMVIDDIEGTISKLSALKRMGIQISIDDFGTGYSSLHYLSQFEIDRLKIDRSFIQSMEKNGEKASAIVKLITLMAKGLNLKVLAEGVEEESQRTFLKDIECDEFQGFLFSRPIAGEEFEKLFAR